MRKSPDGGIVAFLALSHRQKGGCGATPLATRGKTCIFVGATLTLRTLTLTGKKVLVTGASGFIGSFVVKRMLDAGAEVWAAIRPTSSRRYLTDPRTCFIELDLGSDDILRTQLSHHGETHGAWDYVIHAAGATKCADPADFYAINAEGTRRLAEALVELGLLAGRFVFISSLSIFGPAREERVSKSSPHYAPIRATDTPRPDTDYGRSKLQAERSLAAIAGLDYVVMRPTGVYGPRERDYYLMAKSIARHVDFAVGYRPQEITFVFVRDLAEAVVLACLRGKRGAAYFVTDGGVYDSRTFSRLLQRAMGVRGVVRVTAPVALLQLVCAVSGGIARMAGRTTTLNSDKFRILRQRNWQCDLGPTVSDLGYVPRYSLERGVNETINWYKEQKWI